MKVLQLKELTNRLTGFSLERRAIDKRFKRQIGFPARVIGSERESEPKWRQRAVCRRLLPRQQARF